MSWPKSRVSWEPAHRLVPTRFPRIDLFDDVADPHDWEALAAAQAKTNARIYDEIGDLSLVPVERRVSGPGASWVMAAFMHVSADRKTRFGDGTYGVYYAAQSLETAMREHSFHMGRFYADAGMAAGWLTEVRQLVGAIDAALVDIRGGGFGELLDPDDYGPSQAFGRGLRGGGEDGVVYPSVRHAGGACVGVFFPDVVKVPAQGDHFRYYWDGEVVSYVRKVSGDRAIYQLEAG